MTGHTDDSTSGPGLVDWQFATPTANGRQARVRTTARSSSFPAVRARRGV